MDSYHLTVCGLYKDHKEFQTESLFVSEITSEFFKSLRRSVMCFSILTMKFYCLYSATETELNLLESDKIFCIFSR